MQNRKKENIYIYIYAKKNNNNNNNHTQDSIYVVRQFTYVYGVAGISLFSWKNTEVQFFSLKNDIKTLISKITIFISYAQDSQWTTNMGQKNFSWTKPKKISH